MTSDNPPPFLVLGRVLRPHGIRGELRIHVMTAYPERIVVGKVVFVGPDPENSQTAREYTVTRARKHQKFLILQFETIQDRDAADMLRQQYVMLPPEDAVPLEEGEYFLYQLIGVEVYTDEDEHLGTVTEMIQTGANDVYVVRGPRGEVLLPAIDECVLELDLDANKMTVHLMDGLVDD
ncbi:MAG: ribosome maturation factor RimM [Anaerolineae bacterium]|nr:ribosome maturation factor RimM [Anaerolineae bacterium]